MLLEQLDRHITYDKLINLYGANLENLPDDMIFVEDFYYSGPLAKKLNLVFASVKDIHPDTGKVIHIGVFTSKENHALYEAEQLSSLEKRKRDAEAFLNKHK